MLWSVFSHSGKGRFGWIDRGSDIIENSVCATYPFLYQPKPQSTSVREGPVLREKEGTGRYRSSPTPRVVFQISFRQEWMHVNSER